MCEKFDGQAVIKVRFRSNPEYVKFRKYILKTDWAPGDVYPNWEEMTIPFHSSEDLDKVTRTIVMLLQNGFEVYSTKYKLEKHMAEDEYPPEGDEDGDDILYYCGSEILAKEAKELMEI